MVEPPLVGPLVLGEAHEAYPATKGDAPRPELVPSYTRDLGHESWSVQRFWEAQPNKLRGARSWLDRNLPGGSPEELTELEVIMLRLYSGPTFKTWNFFLRYGPGAVLCCTDVPYYEHHNPAWVFCPRIGQSEMCMCGKARGEHVAQELGSWSTSVAVLYSGITKVATASAPATVFRGVNEQRIKLPKSFTEGATDQFAGGVEMAAMSTTTDRNVRGLGRRRPAHPHKKSYPSPSPTCVCAGGRVIQRHKEG